MPDCDHVYVEAIDPHPIVDFAGWITQECVKCGDRRVILPKRDLDA